MASAKSADERFKSSIVQHIKRNFYLHPLYKDVLKRAEVEVIMKDAEGKPLRNKNGSLKKPRKFHRCNICERLLSYKEDKQVDHIRPVIPVDSSYDQEDLGTIFERLVCLKRGIDELQLVCKPCHNAKSKQERADRAKYKRLRKKDAD